MILNLDKHSPESIAVIDSYGERLSYGDILAFRKELAISIPKRSFAFLLSENNAGGVAWIVGCIASGMVPLILNARMDKDLYAHLLDIYRPEYVCAPDDIDVNLENETISKYGYAIYKTGFGTCPMYDGLSHLLPTSGSTGSPKLVRHKYENIEAAALNISTFFQLKSSDRPLLVLPLYYTMGLSVVFSHIYVGATILITGLSMTDPQFWNFMKEHKATSFTGVPYSFEILNMMRFFRMNLPNLTLLTQGGGKLSHQLNLKFAEYCRDNGKRWIATYGQSEGTARMAYLPPEYAVDKCGSIGIAVPNGELSLIDDNGNNISGNGIEGEMCYRGKNVTLGYAYKREDLMLGDERQGFLRTGDIAYRDKDGFYYIVGRKGRFLKLFGMRIGLDECEQIIRSKFSIECACVGSDDKMLIYITDRRYQHKVKEELVAKTKIVASAFEVRLLKFIPKNEAGKILYSRLDN